MRKAEHEDTLHTIGIILGAPLNISGRHKLVINVTLIA
jgi:hypothetical protein